MEQFERIRRDRRDEGLSIRELARKHRVHRRTVRAALADAVPPPRKVPEREAPVTGAHVELVRSWLTQDLDAPLQHQQTNSNRSLLAHFTQDRTRETPWTLREALVPPTGFGRHKTIVGGPARVADQLQDWLRDSGTDGINLSAIVNPGSFTDFGEFVVPELRRRGLLADTPTQPQTLRERIQGAGQRRLRDDHTGASFRVPATA